MLHPATLLQVTSLGPLLVSACQILVSRDSCARATSPTTIPQLCSRKRQALPVGATGACHLGTVTGLPRTNLVLGARMIVLPGDLYFEDVVNVRHLANEVEVHENALHHRTKTRTYPVA